MMFIGSAVIGLGLVLASQIHSLWQFYAAFLIINAGASAGSITTMQAVMVRWFQRYRGRVLGIMESAPSLGSIIVPIMAAAITAFGWQYALAMSGVALLAISLPLSFFIRSRPQDYGLLPDGATAIHAHAPRQRPHPGAGSSRSANELSIGQALRLPAFWFIALSIAMFALATTRNDC